MTEAEQFWTDAEPDAETAPGGPDPDLGLAEAASEPLGQTTNILTHQAWDGLTEVL